MGLYACLYVPFQCLLFNDISLGGCAGSSNAFVRVAPLGFKLHLFHMTSDLVAELSNASFVFCSCYFLTANGSHCLEYPSTFFKNGIYLKHKNCPCPFPCWAGVIFFSFFSLFSLSKFETRVPTSTQPGSHTQWVVL